MTFFVYFIQINGLVTTLNQDWPSYTRINSELWAYE